MKLTIKNKQYEVDTIEQASKLYCDIRDKSGYGASSFTPVVIRDNGNPIAYISYNGKVWQGVDFLGTNNALLFNPYL